METPIVSVDEDATVEERLTDNVVDNILPARYLNRDEDGNVTETPDELFDRVADNIAMAEYEFADTTTEGDAAFSEWRSEFSQLMKTLRLMPNSPTLMNAGNELQQLSACFVDSPDDDMEDIMNTAKEAALIFKSGGGMGYSFSHLRPKGTIVSSTKGTSSGPISFMRLFDETCNQVKQGGVRRGAQMAIMRVDHPDIGRFAVCKREEGALSNFNISAAITDEFREAVQSDDEYTLYSPQSDFEQPFKGTEATEAFYSTTYEDASTEVVNENIWRDHADSIEAWDDGERVSFREKWEDDSRLSVSEGETLTLPARFIWDLLIDGAWRNGEPGLFHLDETNRKHSFGDLDGDNSEYKIRATNPCGEQPLSEYEACNLAHVNLSLMVKDDASDFDTWFDNHRGEYATRTDAVEGYLGYALDHDDLYRTIDGGVRLLDNVVTMSDFPLDDIEQRVSEMRKVGLGVMGWAQMCYQMGIRYGSEPSLVAAEHVMSIIDKRATDASHNLALERGTFDAWEKSKYADPLAYPDWFESHTHENPEDWPDGYPMRNHNVTTVAPTGTTSMIGDTSGGIEPVFSVAYKKNVGEDIQGEEKLVEFDSYFIETLEANGYDVEEMKEIAAAKMDANEFDGVTSLPIHDKLKEVFVTTNDLSPRQHVLMQRAFQSAVDSGISKTVNLPTEATHEDVHDAYTLGLSEDAHGAPVKGLTVYRDQSRGEQVKTTQEYSDIEVENAKEMLEDLGYTVTDAE